MIFVLFAFLIGEVTLQVIFYYLFFDSYLPKVCHLVWGSTQTILLVLSPLGFNPKGFTQKIHHKLLY